MSLLACRWDDGIRKKSRYNDLYNTTTDGVLPCSLPCEKQTNARIQSSQHIILPNLSCLLSVPHQPTASSLAGYFPIKACTCQLPQLQWTPNSTFVAKLIPIPQNCQGTSSTVLQATKAHAEKLGEQSRCALPQKPALDPSHVGTYPSIASIATGLPCPVGVCCRLKRQFPETACRTCLSNVCRVSKER